jgi:Flp pilus assembly protein TadD
MIGLTLLLGGCAAGAGEGRPILAMDGQHLDASDPVERGRALVLTGQYGLAIEGLSEAVARDPGNARALSLLAVSYAQVKRFDLADRYHAQALEIDPVPWSC